MGARVTIAMSVFNQLALTGACLESLRATTEPFRLVVVDNGSTDDTPRFFERFDYPWPLRFERNSENRSVIAALNRAWRLSGTEYVCVLLNDTELVEPARALRPPRRRHARPRVRRAARGRAARPGGPPRSAGAVQDEVGHRLPCDVRSRGERVTAWLRARRA